MGVNDRERFFGNRCAEQWRSTTARADDSSREPTAPGDPEHGCKQREGDEGHREAGISWVFWVSAAFSVDELSGRRGRRADPKRRGRRRRSHGDGRGGMPGRPRRSVGTRRGPGRNVGARSIPPESIGSTYRRLSGGAYTIPARATR
jgi:hypothetical protein